MGVMMSNDLGTCYGVLAEIGGCSLQIRRINGAYNLCLTNGEETKLIPLRSGVAMSLVMGAMRADLRGR